MLSPDAAGDLADRFDLGDGARLEGPAARGQLGQVWCLVTSAGRFAIKEWFATPDPSEVDRDANFSELARAGGVLTPAVRRTVDGEVTARVGDTMVRVSEWVELLPRTRDLDPGAVGSTLARLHRVGPALDEPVSRWFSEGFGPLAWYALLEHLVDNDAPFAWDFAPYCGPFIEVESVMEVHTSPILCHRDLWADNVLGTPNGDVCVIDFENAGPADPSQELAMVLYEFGDDDPERARDLYATYLAEGGPGRITRMGNFTMLVAEQAHIAHYAASRWMGETDDVERKRLEAWFRELLDDPVILPRIERILAALT